MHCSIRRHCIDFEMANVQRKNSDENSNIGLVHLSLMRRMFIMKSNFFLQNAMRIYRGEFARNWSTLECTCCLKRIQRHTSWKIVFWKTTQSAQLYFFANLYKPRTSESIIGTCVIWKRIGSIRQWGSACWRLFPAISLHGWWRLQSEQPQKEKASEVFNYLYIFLRNYIPLFWNFPFFISLIPNWICRRKSETPGETEGCKRCNCKKSKCLKL